MGETSSSTFVLICLCVRNSLGLLYFFLCLSVCLSEYSLFLLICFHSLTVFPHSLFIYVIISIFFYSLYTFSFFLNIFLYFYFLFGPIFFSSTCRCIVLWSIENHKLNPVAVKLFSLMCPFSISYQTLARQKRQKKTQLFGMSFTLYLVQ